MRNLAVHAVLYYLRFFARLALRIRRPKIIGITGSVGKTSARNAVYAMLRHSGETKVIEHGNSETGVPLGILGLEAHNYSIFEWFTLLLKSPFKINYHRKTKYLIIEMGIDEPDPPKNMGYLLTIVKPDISVFLNVHPAHTMQFDKTVSPDITGKERLEKILENIGEEKGRIITESGAETAIYNADNKYVRDVVISKHLSSTTLLSFGEEKENNIFYKNYKVSLSGTHFSFGLDGEDFDLYLKNYLLPEEYREIFASTLLVGKSLGMSIDDMKQNIENNFTLPPGRSSMLEGINSTVIIDSSYNASKAAVLAFLHLIKKIKDDRKVVFLFGDMRELGRESEFEHKTIASEIEKVVDFLYCVGPQTKQFVIPNVKKMRELKWFENSFQAGEYLQDHLPKDSLVLVKGSQNTIFLEEAIKQLLANKEDTKKLCRQSPYWLKVKGIHS